MKTTKAERMMICATELASFEWCNHEDENPENFIVVGPMSSSWKGRLKSRALKKHVNKMAGKKLFPETFLTKKQMEYLDEVMDQGPKMFCDRSPDVPPKGKMFETMRSLGLVKVKRDYYMTGYYNKPVKLTDKGRSALCGDGTFIA